MHRLIILVVILAAGAGCRGSIQGDEPIHLNLNMDFQQRFDPQEPNPFFEDNRSMRPPVAGTVARGLLREDVRFYVGRESNGAYVAEMPVPVTRDLLERGQERYDIFCAVCHGQAGDGQGIIMTGTSNVTGRGYGYTPVPSYHIDRLRQVEDGYMYDVIANGVRNMPPYAKQIPVADRWAIVSYVRALQRSQNATVQDVPAGEVANAMQQGAQSSSADASEAGAAPAAAPADSASGGNE